MDNLVNFRVWNEKDGWYFEDLTSLSLGLSKEGNLVCKNLGFYDEVLFEQFVGIIDKNNKKVYEGDIIKETTEEPRPDCNYYLGDYWMEDGSDPMEKQERFFYIEREHPNFFRRIYINGFLTCSGDRDGEPVKGLLNADSNNGYLEVVGNINENPELLEDVS